ncbi:MAG: anti-sigma factor family protein [Polyangiaceae bacterium]
MMRCTEVTELTTEYLNGRLPFWHRLAFRMHVAMCRHCRAFLDHVRKTITLLGRLPPQPVPPETRAELLRQFRQNRRSATMP